MNRNPFDRRTCLVGAAMVISVLLFVRPSTLPVASAQDANANKKPLTNTSAPKKTPKKPKKRSTANSNTSNAADVAADERTFWESIRNSTDPADFHAYLEEYPDGKYVTLATNRLNSLQAAANSSRPNTTSSPPASTTSTGKPFRNNKGIEMVWIPSGSFDMGSNNGEADEKPVHRVTISQGFYMGKYEVTQAQWQAVMGSNPSSFKGDNLPVETVSWDDVQQFIGKLNEMNDGYKYRLPTEAEWEYACRAGTTTEFSFGSSLSSDQANFDGNEPYGGAAKGVYREKTMPVGSFAPNAFGLFDMHGNVWEWCEDWYHDTYAGAPTDGSAWLSGGAQTNRVLRGGSWYDYAANLRSAYRYYSTPDDRNSNYGFRLVAVVRTQ